MGHIPPLQDFDDPTYAPLMADELAYGDMADPYPLFRHLAAKGKVQEGDIREAMGMVRDETLGDQRIFMVFGYDEIREVQSNTDNYTVEYHRAGLGKTFGAYSLSVLDPPEHSRYRRIFQKAFLPHVVASWSDEFIEPVISELLGRFAQRGRCDLMQEFVALYPFEIIYKQLRFPPDEAKIFKRLSVALTLYMVDLAHGQEAHEKLGAYFREVIKERRRTPGTDLISVLVTTELDGEYLPDEVLLSFFRQLMNAAGDTTFRSTGNLLVHLLADRPDQFDMLKRDRTLIAKAIEETLRLEPPVNFNYRTAARDVELAGVHIPKGSLITTMTGAANRDPAIYADPDTFDMLRPMPRTHLAFISGHHICLGQHLARLEMTRALNILLDRFPRLRLDADHPRPQIRGNAMRCPRHIHVRFD